MLRCFHHRVSILSIRLALVSITSLGMVRSVPLAAQSSAEMDPLRRFNASVETLVKRVSPSVVQVTTTGYGAIGESDRANAGLIVGVQHTVGSGFIVDPAGYIITNAHVVANAQQVQVVIPIVSNDSTPAGPQGYRPEVVTATIVGVAREFDLAVIKIDRPMKLPSLSLANYADLRQGQVVFAFGSPGGLPNSVTMGILSATARQTDPDSPMAYIQTDAPINPGNSGGPLVNVNGEVVGVNTFIVSQSGGNEGLGFAIPSAIIKSTYQQIRQFGHVHRGEIGLDVQTITPALATVLNLSQTNGLLVSDVLPGGASDSAGIHIQDVITKVDGAPVSGVPYFRFHMMTHAGGENVHLDVVRGMLPLAFDVHVMRQPHGIDQLATLVDPTKSLVRPLGILGIQIDPRIAGAVPGLRDPYGILVIARAAGAIAEVPLSSGDVIRTLNGDQMTTLDKLRSALQAIPNGVPVVMQIQHDEHLMFISFTLDRL